MQRDREALMRALELAREQVSVLEAALGIKSDQDSKLASISDEVRSLWRELAPGRSVPDMERLATWRAQGYSRQLVLAVVRERLAAKPDIGRLTYFDRPLAEAQRFVVDSEHRPRENDAFRV